MYVFRCYYSNYRSIACNKQCGCSDDWKWWRSSCMEKWNNDRWRIINNYRNTSCLGTGQWGTDLYVLQSYIHCCSKTSPLSKLWQSNNHFEHRKENYKFLTIETLCRCFVLDAVQTLFRYQGLDILSQFVFVTVVSFIRLLHSRWNLQSDQFQSFCSLKIL